MPPTAWQLLGDHLRETQILGSIQNTLYWDQNTKMPSAGAAWRAEQLSFLAKAIHARQSSKQFECLLEESRVEFEHDRRSGNLGPLDVSERARNLELLEQELTRQKRLDPQLIAALANAKAIGYDRWKTARENSDFTYFAPALSQLIELRKEQARQLSEPRSCWETLAQPFEPDLSITRLQELFAPLRQSLPDLLEKLEGSSRPVKPLWDLEEKAQQDLCDLLLQQWGQDQSITTSARSPHPFSITLGPKDFRLSNRVVVGQPLSCFLATAHEWGHSLYEQGLPSQSHQWFCWPLGQATSMAVHESQSLFWENRVARSKAFSERFWKYFVKAGAPIDSSQELWFAMNPLTPGLNRVEADELTYGLHILIRFDLEVDLLENGLSVEDVPSEWNIRYRDLLGVTPSHDGEGCLQDVHWSEGQFGYFPSYLLGHLISAQLSVAMADGLRNLGVEGDDPLSTCISSGEEVMLLNWFRENVHKHGRQKNAEGLVEEVTGGPLSPFPFLSYLETKVKQLCCAS